MYMHLLNEYSFGSLCKQNLMNMWKMYHVKSIGNVWPRWHGIKLMLKGLEAYASGYVLTVQIYFLCSLYILVASSMFRLCTAQLFCMILSIYNEHYSILTCFYVCYMFEMRTYNSINVGKAYKLVTKTYNHINVDKFHARKIRY